MLDDISISLLCTILGGALAYLTFTKNQKKDIEENTKEKVMIIAQAQQELKYVAKGINEIKTDIKEVNLSIRETNERVVRLEEVSRQHEDRIRKLEEEQ